jgi:hypothetical protein
MRRSGQTQTFILIGFGILFVLFAIALGISWLIGGEIHRSELLMVIGGLGIIGSLLWMRYAQRPSR